jgi:hypothetical protein
MPFGVPTFCAPSNFAGLFGPSRFGDSAGTVFPGNDRMKRIYGDQAEIVSRLDL